MSGYRARIKCSMSLSTRLSCAARATSSATSFGCVESTIAGAPANDTGAGFCAPKGSASKGVMGGADATIRPEARANDDSALLDLGRAWGRAVAAPRIRRYRRGVEFMAHQDQLALQRLRDQGGF